MRIGKTIAWAAGGLAAAPLLDYAWHAWVAHARRPLPTRAEHLEHHRTAHTEGDPIGEIRDNAGLVGKAGVTIAAALSPLLGPGAAFPLAAGLAAGYVAITLSHARMHVRAPRTRWEEWMWRFHFHHHYANPRANYGLTSPIFDFVFRTAEVPEQVTIPEEALPHWWTGEAHGFRVRRPAGRASTRA